MNGSKVCQIRAGWLPLPPAPFPISSPSPMNTLVGHLLCGRPNFRRCRCLHHAPPHSPLGSQHLGYSISVEGTEWKSRLQTEAASNSALSLRPSRQGQLSPFLQGRRLETVLPAVMVALSPRAWALPVEPHHSVLAAAKTPQNNHSPKRNEG